jgi:hypothetical protein
MFAKNSNGAEIDLQKPSNKLLLITIEQRSNDNLSLHLGCIHFTDAFIFSNCCYINVGVWNEVIFAC